MQKTHLDANYDEKKDRYDHPNRDELGAWEYAAYWRYGLFKLAPKKAVKQMAFYYGCFKEFTEKGCVMDVEALKSRVAHYYNFVSNNKVGGKTLKKWGVFDT